MKRLLLVGVLVALTGCEVVNLPPPKPKEFAIEIEVKKSNHQFKSLRLTFNDVVGGQGYPYFETQKKEEVSNVIKSLEQTIAELKAIEEQIKVNSPPSVTPIQP